MRKAPRLTATICLLAMLPFLTGCGVIFGGTRQNIRALSSPEGASVVTNPVTQDYKTPTSLSLERKQEVTLEFSMPGYSSQSVRLERSMRTGILIADILLTGLIGIVVDAATGAWYKLSPEVASVTLTKAGAGVGPATITIAINVKSDKNQDKIEIVSSVPGVAVDVKAH